MDGSKNSDEAMSCSISQKCSGKYILTPPCCTANPSQKIADEIISMCHIPYGNYDNVADCKYLVPDYWTIGDVFERLITDSHSEGDIMDTAELIYNAWITDAQLDFNSDFYYQPRDYIYACYREGGYLDG